MNFLRYLLILPAAFLATVIIYPVFLAITDFSLGRFLDLDGFLVVTFKEIMGSAISAAWFVICGVLVAPSHKKQISIALLVLFSVMTGMSLIMTFESMIGSSSILEILAGIGGAVGGYYWLHETDFQPFS